MSDLLLLSPREAQWADITCLEEYNTYKWDGTVSGLQQLTVITDGYVSIR